MDAVRDRVKHLDLPADDPLLELVVRHERQHAETMLQTLALAALADWQPPSTANAQGGSVRHPSGLDLVEVEGARFAVGADGSAFAYDNELPQHEITVAPFAIGRVPVTNDDWAAFIADGGYRRREWWSAEGWEWRSSADAQRPLQWLDGRHERRLTGVCELVADSPVMHISWFEADAFARARGLRLPTEAEWELAATFDHETASKRRWPWGESGPGGGEANLIESGLFAPTSVGFPEAGAAPCGALGMIGDVWEWTASEFAGYPHFEAHPYREYSEVFFGDAYRVLRGGSFATSELVATPTFRNWDLPARRQIFAGLRVADSR